MSEHLSAQDVGRYLRRAMTPAELLSADDHLAACDACRMLAEGARAPATADSFSQLRADLQAAASPGHLAYEQLAAYVDDEVDEVEREIIDSHMTICLECKREMTDLFAFKETMAAAPATATGGRVYAPAFREKLLAFWRAPYSLLNPRLAAVAVILLVGVMTVAIWLGWQRARSSQTEVAVTPHAPATVESPRTPVAPSTNITSEGEQPSANVSANVSAENRSPAEQDRLARGRRRERTGAVPTQSAAPDPYAQTFVVALNDGQRRVTLDQQGRVEGLETLLPREQQSIKTALETQRVETSPALTGLAGVDGTLMGGAGGGGSFALLSPTGSVVRAERPQFRWQPLEGASSYVVTIYDSNFNKVAASPALTKTEWTPASPLERGNLYTWQVTVMKEGKEVTSPAPPAPEARFRVLDRAKAEELTRVEQSAPDSHLARGVHYAQAGLLEDAEREFQSLLAANPKSQVARNLLDNVRALRRGGAQR